MVLGRAIVAAAGVGVAAVSVVGVAACPEVACSVAARSVAASERQSSGVAGVVEVVYGDCSSISDAVFLEAVSLRWMALSGMRRKKRNGPASGTTSMPWAWGL